MVYKPRPEVAAVRDAATKICKTLGARADLAVIVFTTTDGRMGAASYGRDGERCGVARRLADVLYETTVQKLEEVEERQGGEGGS